LKSLTTCIFNACSPPFQTFGTIPWQTYFQRVLSVKTAKYAQVLSIAGGLGAFILAVPSIFIGIASLSTGKIWPGFASIEMSVIIATVKGIYFYCLHTVDIFSSTFS